MAVNKNALLRYQVLDKCFRNTGRMYFWEDLLDECNDALTDYDPNYNGISRRQLFDDIRFMESEQGWSIPLERFRFGKKVYYRYSDTNFSINNQPLNDSEAEKIKSAIQILSRFSGTPQFEWINEMIPMLESKFGLIDRKREVIGFDYNLDLKGIHFLSPLFNAIVNERVLKIRYQDFKSQIPYEVIVHPYYLKQYNNRWFLLGLRGESENIWTLALDRIEGMDETNFVFVHSEMDWEDYFSDMIGVTRLAGSEVQKVVLEFTPEVFPYVTTKPIHQSQKSQREINDFTISIQLIPNYELENLILSFGDSVKVISPIFLKERIAQRIKTASNLY